MTTTTIITYTTAAMLMVTMIHILMMPVSVILLMLMLDLTLIIQPTMIIPAGTVTMMMDHMPMISTSSTHSQIII